MGFTPESARKAAETRHANKLAQEARAQEFKEASSGTTTEAATHRDIPSAASHIYAGPSNAEVEKRDAEIRARNHGLPKVELTREGFDKNLFDKRDAIDFDPEAEDNPLRDAVDRYREPGMAYKALSPTVTAVHGLRGYEPVLKENGDQVTIGRMFLGKIPQDLADRRQRKYQRESMDRIKDMGNTQKDIVAQARGLGLRVIEPGEQMRGDYSTEITRG